MTRQAGTEAIRYLRTEAVGGIVMLIAAIIALILANTGAQDWYHDILESRIGPHGIHLDLTVSQWFADGVLAIFFFVVGLELKRELVIGQLRSLKLAMLPVFAALGGMIVPGIIAFAISRGAQDADKAWSVPLATDIAFAVAVLAIAAAKLASSVRIFLLSIAVVDDLGAILIIATVFTDNVDFIQLGIAVALLVLYALLQKFRVQGPLSAFFYVPIGLGVWYFVHGAGIHATIAGVALGLLTRVKQDPGEQEPPAIRVEHRVQPFSAGVVVPLFALSAAGITLTSSAVGAIFTNPLSIAIIVGLVIGKPTGVLLGAFVSVKTRLANLPHGLAWPDIAAVGVIAGIGFTVSLLIAELALPTNDSVALGKAAVLVASAIASVLGAIVLALRSRRVSQSRRDLANSTEHGAI